MSAITDKIARLTAEDNGELNGIVNGGLLAEILTGLANKIEGSFNLLASAEAVDGTDAAYTFLTNAENKTSETHFPTHLVIEKTAGEVDGLELLFFLDDVLLCDNFQLGATSSATKFVFAISTPVAQPIGDADYKIRVWTIGGSGLLFNVKVYGYSY